MGAILRCEVNHLHAGEFPGQRLSFGGADALQRPSREVGHDQPSRGRGGELPLVRHARWRLPSLARNVGHANDDGFVDETLRCEIYVRTFRGDDFIPSEYASLGDGSCLDIDPKSVSFF